MEASQLPQAETVILPPIHLLSHPPSDRIIHIGHVLKMDENKLLQFGYQGH